MAYAIGQCPPDLKHSQLSLARCREHPAGHPEVNNFGTPTSGKVSALKISCSQCGEPMLYTDVACEHEAVARWNSGAHAQSAFNLPKAKVQTRFFELKKQVSALREKQKAVADKIEPLKLELKKITSELRGAMAEFGEFERAL